MQLKERIHHEIPGKPWEAISTMFSLYNEQFLYIADYHSKISIIKGPEVLSVGSLILACKIIFKKMGYPRK